MLEVAAHPEAGSAWLGRRGEGRGEDREKKEEGGEEEEGWGEEGEDGGRRGEEQNGEEQEGEKELERSRGRDCPVLEWA